MVEDWSDNATLNAPGGCTYVTAPRSLPSPPRTASAVGGGAGGGSVFNPAGSVVRPGSLYNAMVLPWVNYTVRGAIWCESRAVLRLCAVTACCDCGHAGPRRSPLPHALSLRTRADDASLT